MSLASQVLLYRGRCRQDHDFENIELQFHVSKRTAYRIFWSVAFKHSSCANLIPKLWSNPDLTMAQKNNAYARLAEVSPFYQTIASFIRDPADLDRKNIFIMIDGILLGVPYTADLFAQKSCYYLPKKDHYIRYINICNARGEIILFLPPTPSISPTHGDERATGAFLWLDDDREKQGLPVITGLGQLLRGSDKWHVNVVGDYGFVHRPARLGDDGIEHLNDFVQNCGGTFMHPGGINGDEDLIYQVDADGMLVPTNSEDLVGSTTLRQNYRGMVGFCRRFIEQGQGGKFSNSAMFEINAK